MQELASRTPDTLVDLPRSRNLSCRPIRTTDTASKNLPTLLTFLIKQNLIPIDTLPNTVPSRRNKGHSRITDTLKISIKCIQLRAASTKSFRCTGQAVRRTRSDDEQNFSDAEVDPIVVVWPCEIGDVGERGSDSEF